MTRNTPRALWVAVFTLLILLAFGAVEAEVCQDCYEGTKQVGDFVIHDAQCCIDGDSFCSQLAEDLTLDQDDVSSCNLVSTTEGGWICDGENLLYSCSPYDGIGDGDILNQDIGGSDDDCSGIGFCPAYCSSCGDWV